MISTLELIWTNRVLTGSQTPVRFLDFVVDGEPLYPVMGDVISPLGWLPAEQNKLAADRLLRKATADFPDGRRSLYVCPECAGPGCGAVSVIIERQGDNIIWRDFGYQNDYDETVHFEDFEDLGPFTFDASDYYRVISSALDLKDE